MRKYQAVDRHDHPLTTVGAEDERAARARIANVLNREGRYDFYKMWLVGGKKVREVTQ